MRKHTTKRALQAIQYHRNSLLHYEEVRRVKQLPLENQADYIQEKSLEYFEGWIVGIQAMTEHVLHTEGSYYGFHYINSKGEWLTHEKFFDIRNDPEYRSFRIEYFIK